MPNPASESFWEVSGESTRRGAIAGTIPPGSSALFILFESVTEDKVLAEIELYKPRVLKTSLSNEAEQRLTTVLSKTA